MSCEHAERDLDALLDRELDVESSTAVRDHLGECAACRRQVTESELFRLLVQGAPHYSTPAGLRERVLALVTQARLVSTR